MPKKEQTQAEEPVVESSVIIEQAEYELVSKPVKDENGMVMGFNQIRILKELNTPVILPGGLGGQRTY
jgi:hypothetical protein